MKATLRDVAQAAGVSVQTASHVLSKNPSARIAQSTREKVEAAALKLQYSPNRYAQAMKGGKTNLIGILMPLDRSHATYLRFLNGLRSQTQVSGHDLMIYGLDTPNAQNWEGKLPPMWPVDALISIDAGRLLKVFRDDPRNEATPLAIFGLENYTNCDSVTWNLRAAAAEANRSMASSGSRRIAYVTPGWMIEAFPSEQRRRGYEEAMAEIGQTPIFITPVDESVDAAHHAVAEALRKDPTIDGLFCFHDLVAFGALSACQAAGKSIPQDVQVWGCNNLLPPDVMAIPLSTINIPVERCVTALYAWLMERMRGEANESRLTILDMDMIPRASSR